MGQNIRKSGKTDKNSVLRGNYPARRVKKCKKLLRLYSYVNLLLIMHY